MTDVPPPDPLLPAAPETDTAAGEGAPQPIRKPRKRFILVGLGIGLGHAQVVGSLAGVQHVIIG